MLREFFIFAAQHVLVSYHSEPGGLKMWDKSQIYADQFSKKTEKSSIRLKAGGMRFS